MDKGLTKALLNEHEGELLTYEDENFTVKVSYSSGTLPMFSKLEVFILDKSQLQLTEVDGKIKVSDPKELEKAFELYQFRNFVPLLEFALTDKETPSFAVEETKENIKNGLFPFVRPKTGKVETLVVAVGNLARRGLFYYPDHESPVIELIELGEKLKVHKDNLRLISEA